MYDMKNLGKLESLAGGAPDTMKAFVEFDKLALSDGAIPKKYKELIALGVALTTQCTYCLEVHRKAALDAGVTEQEFSELTMIAMALRAGAALTHGTHLLKG